MTAFKSRWSLLKTFWAKVVFSPGSKLTLIFAGVMPMASVIGTNSTLITIIKMKVGNARLSFPHFPLVNLFVVIFYPFCISLRIMLPSGVSMNLSRVLFFQPLASANSLGIVILYWLLLTTTFTMWILGFCLFRCLSNVCGICCFIEMELLDDLLDDIGHVGDVGQ